MKKKSVWKILALSGALVMAVSCTVMYSSMKGEGGVSGDSERVTHATYATVTNEDTNETSQSKTNQTTIPLEKPPFID